MDFEFEDSSFSGTFVILPRGRQPALYRWDGEEVEYAGVVGAPADAPTCIRERRGVVGAITHEGRKVKSWEIDGDELGAANEDRMMPEGARAHCLTVLGDQLYVGGRAGRGSKAILWRSSLEESPAEWHEVPVPDRVVGGRKTVDALFAKQRRLVAVDDVVYPKWVLSYETAGGGRPRLEDVVKLPHHHTYEQIFAAGANDRWIALCSGGMGRAGSGRYLSLLDRQSLHEEFLWKTFIEAGEDGEHTLRGVALTERRMFVASDSRGVGVVDLEAVVEARGLGYRGSRPTTHQLDDIEYVEVDVDEPIVAVKTVEGYEGCFAMYQEDELAYGWEWVE